MPQDAQALKDYGYQYEKGDRVNYIIVHDGSGTLVRGDAVPAFDALGIRKLDHGSEESNGYKIYPDSSIRGWNKPDEEYELALMEQVVAVAADARTGDGRLLLEVLKEQGIPVSNLSADKFRGAGGKRAPGK